MKKNKQHLNSDSQQKFKQTEDRKHLRNQHNNSNW